MQKNTYDFTQKGISRAKCNDLNYPYDVSPSSWLIRGSGNDFENMSMEGLEEYLLSLCQDFERDNKLIQIRILYLCARKETKIPRARIEIAIDHLIQDKRIIPGKFLYVQSVLKNGTRKRLYELIASRPAFQALDLKDVAGIGARILA
ncbi:MAG: hypothetical protein RBG13Loki_1411 [Promethearchaeota archaeon CR_4]|nr:MAG: hypothetical protein RBG13Loki_1411 [Candidatus Lokiarchaeota archaeon CR_4]